MLYNFWKLCPLWSDHVFNWIIIEWKRFKCSIYTIPLHGVSSVLWWLAYDCKPPAFNFRTPDKWSRWKKRFEQLRLASGLSEEAREKLVSTLLYCMEENADNTLTSINIKEDVRKEYQTVIEKFNGFSKYEETLPLIGRGLTIAYRRRESQCSNLWPASII